MTIVADLHIHGRYSRATSKNLSIETLEKYARIKGVDLRGAGDFTHPIWIEHLKEKLGNETDGIYRTATNFPFMLTTEISLIYTWNGKGRRIHNVVTAPSFDVVDQITEWLKTKGRVDYDGRPIFKIPCPEFVESLRSISKDIEVIPAHIWTPYFSLFGEYNQFSTVKECFEDQTKHIHALETGLSSDPPMNWRIPELDNYTMVSFSDLHSYWPWKVGREATLFDTKYSYMEIINAMRRKEKIAGTIEVDPGYGKYHINGHRKCDISMSPSDSAKINHICPKCNRKFVIGVEQRVEELAKRPYGYKPKGAIPYQTLMPLSEILSSLLGKGLMTKTVSLEYERISKLGSEFDILKIIPKKELLKVTNLKIANAIMKNRIGDIKVKPGYDGLYGKAVF